ncbi:DUF2218 domain-containing protein [Amycolatopsis alkalitolerans]|uniref:DUF2218 domain-containing protein n=1 Tax=Amycolatopsis alkalitolerans TaxID=2547244 RepID=A0A5C4LUI9_9PSEU|nr:DUF2218 domain-containing protein [Amycolatopsis alkalitolerans]TNC21551.1 DUF2218 domain-containing protein [Amycolatopsis alkalitolerans]
MPTAEARVPTERASRYLVQFCRHTSQMSRMRHRPPGRHGVPDVPAVEHAEWSDTAGTVRFARGSCTLRAEPTALTLRVEAADGDALRALQDGITRRLRTIGRRDRLIPRWHPSGDVPASPPAPAGRRPGRMRAPAWVAAAALAVVAHLGLAASTWGRWGADALLTVVAVKVLVVGAHLLLRRGGWRPRGR